MISPVSSSLISLLSIFLFDLFIALIPTNFDCMICTLQLTQITPVSCLDNCFFGSNCYLFYCLKLCSILSAIPLKKKTVMAKSMRSNGVGSLWFALYFMDLVESVEIKSQNILKKNRWKFIYMGNVDQACK